MYSWTRSNIYWCEVCGWARMMVAKKKRDCVWGYAYYTVRPESSQVDFLIDLEPPPYGPPTGPGRLPYPPLPVTLVPPSFAASEPTLDPVPVSHYASCTRGQPTLLWRSDCGRHHSAPETSGVPGGRQPSSCNTGRSPLVIYLTGGLEMLFFFFWQL